MTSEDDVLAVLDKPLAIYSLQKRLDPSNKRTDALQELSAGSGCLNSFPRKISGILPGFSVLRVAACVLLRREGVARPE
jgi:hypothetical protein